MTHTNSPDTETATDHDSDHFYDSLDRILSSSNSSTSDDDAADHRRSAHRTRRRTHRRLASPLLHSLDAWTSELSTVADRRRRLLRLLGLSSDPSLSRRPPIAGASDVAEGTGRPRSEVREGFRGADCRSAGTLGTEVDGCSEEGVGCLIRDLDNGKEFVVRDIGADGAWDMVRDVETGRQLTMEEFDVCVGRSRIVQELMRRCNAESTMELSGGGLGGEMRLKRNGGWLRSVKNIVEAMMVLRGRDKKSCDEKDTLSEKGGARSSSATDDSQDGGHGLHHVNSRRIKVRRHGRWQKELNSLFLNQEIQAHDGAIWTIKFSCDGRYLASAGEDLVIHVWEVVEKASEESSGCPRLGVGVNNDSPEPTSGLDNATKGNLLEGRRSAKLYGSRKYVNFEPVMVEHVFALSEKPTCSFVGHLDDILDLSWSKSLHLLSSSMDMTVRLWHMSSKTCLKIFSHCNYVTCIQFNPVDDRFFISGSLDEKVRIWSIPDRQVVDWNDLHEMVTAVCYTPDGQSVLVGTHNGNCHFFDTSDNKLLRKSQVELGNMKKKSRHKKITGFQFSPGSARKVLITAAGSRIWLVEGDNLVHKFKGFHNSGSQFSAYFTPNGKHLICASEDSSVYLWKFEDNSQPSQNKGVPAVTESYEHFHCEGVTVAVPWQISAMREMPRNCSNIQNSIYDESQLNSPSHSKVIGLGLPRPAYNSIDYERSSSLFSTRTPNSNHLNDRVSITWPEELMAKNKRCTLPTADLLAEGIATPSRSACGLVIVTAGRGGQIRAFQNYGFPAQK